MNRGGSWNNNARNARAANRNNATPDNRNNNLGFRLSSTRAARYCSGQGRSVSATVSMSIRPALQ